MNFIHRFLIAGVVAGALALAPAASAATSQVISEPGSEPYSPRLTLTADGRAYVTWLAYFDDLPGDPRYSRVASVAADGSATPPTDLGGPGADIAAGPGQDATTIWEAERDDFRLQRIGPDGDAAPPVFLAADPDLGRSSWGDPQARVAVGPDGTATVAWIGRRGEVLARRVGADGTVGAVRRVGEAGGSLFIREIGMHVDSRNRTTIAFAAKKQRIAVARLRPNGTVQGRSRLRGFDGFQMVSDFAPNGRGLLAWRTRKGLYAARVSKTGRIGRALRADNATNRRLSDPRVAAGPDGRGVVAWTSKLEAGDRERHDVVYSVLGRKGKPSRARTAARNARRPAVAFGRGRRGTGAAIAVVSRDAAVRLLAVRRSGQLEPVESIPATGEGRRVGTSLEFDPAGRPVLVWIEGASVVLAR